MSAVITVPQSRPIDRRPAWIIFAAVAVASATALTVTLVNRENSSAPVSPALSKVYSGQAVTGTGAGLTAVAQESQLGVPSTRPLSDAAFEISAIGSATEFYPYYGAVRGTGPGLERLATESSSAKAASSSGPAGPASKTAEAPAGSPADVHSRNLVR